MESKHRKGADSMQSDFPRIDVYKTGQNIRRLMNRQGLTVKDIQKYLGLSVPQSIYHWFDGRSLPTIDNLYALSELFGMPVDMLLRGNRKKSYGFYECSTHKWIIAYYEKFLELRAS